MAKCVACGKNVLITNSMGNLTFCNNCASMINLSKWKKRDCETIDELICYKNNAIQSANQNGFPNDVIGNIEQYFDAYINAGYAAAFNGKVGQTLKIFADFCIIDTKSETKKNELMNRFYFEEEDDEEAEEEDIFFNAKNVGRIAKGFMSGRVVETSVGLAASAFANTKAREQAEEKRIKIEQAKRRARRRKMEQLISVGERRVNLKDYIRVESFNGASEQISCLRFVPRGLIQQDEYSYIYFFYNNTSLVPFESRKIKQKIEMLRDMLNDRITRINTMIERKEVHEEKLQKEIETIVVNAANLKKEAGDQNKEKRDVFEEIRKFKELLDEGIITEEDFIKKKKELLGL